MSGRIEESKREREREREREDREEKDRKELADVKLHM